MECHTMQFQREYYSRPTSPDSISAYHATSGYLSHPHSGPKRSTAEDTFMSPTTGLGITHPYGFQLQQEHQSFYAARQEYPKFPSDIQRDFSSSERGPSPQQANPFSLPSYIHHSKHLSYYMTLGHARSPPHHSQSNLARTAGGNAWEPSTFYEHMMSPSIADDLESRHFRYQPDALQDGRWANASCEVSYTTSSEPSNITAWDSNGFHEHVYHDQYAVLPSARMSLPVDESQATALSTPPASQKGKPAQDRDIYSPIVPRGSSRGAEVEGVEQYSTSPSTTTSEPTPTSRSRTGSQERIGKRPSGRLPKASAVQPSLCCSQCPKTFSRQSRLRDHETSHMNGNSAAVCLEPRCNKVYGRHADLARHQRSHHKGHLFPCKYCSKTFNRSDITRRHEEQSCRQRRAERASVATIRPNIRSK